jgi:DNA repair exonuclease SbcCD ATPase subunit
MGTSTKTVKVGFEGNRVALLQSKNTKINKSTKTKKNKKMINVSKNTKTVKVSKNNKTKKVIKTPKYSKKVKHIEEEEEDEDEDVEIKVLQDDGEDITKIYHISDIHISKYNDRHPEFLTVFKRLCTEIKKDPENSIIYVGGDILHEPNRLSPPQLLLAKQFFRLLSNITIVAVIIGNHDSVKQENVIDSITPILKNLRTKNKIFLLNERKNYIINNLCFGMTPMNAKRVTPCNVKNKIKIGVCHTTLIGSKNNAGFDLSDNATLKPSDFKRFYSYTLLGDVHKHMYLDSAKTVAYCGSLLQTRFGESRNSGMLKWDLLTGKSVLIPIKNDHAFLTIHANKEGLAKEDLVDMPKYPVIKLEYTDISSAEAEKHLTDLRKKYNAKCSLVRKISEKLDITMGKGKNKKKLIDISDDKTVSLLVTRFMKKNFDYDKKTTIAVKRKVTEILNSIDYTYCNQVKQFSLKNIKFDNFFNYGSGNSLDYEKMVGKGLHGISGRNHSGKSTSAIDVLLYSLYGKCSRGDKFDAVNTRKKKMTTDVSFKLNSDMYRVVRVRKISGETTKRDSTEKTVLYKNDVNISKTTVDKTNAYITQILCPYNQFVNTSMIPQFGVGTSSFINISDKDRKNTICNLLKLDVFNSILTTARSEICQINYFLASLRKDSKKPTKRDSFDKNTKVNAIKIKIKELEQKYMESQNLLENLQEVFESNKKEMYEYESKKKEYADINTTIKKIKKVIEKINNDLKTNENDLTDTENNIKILNNKLIKLNDEKDEIVISLEKFNDIDIIYEKFKTDRDSKLESLNKQLEESLSSRTPNNELGKDASKVETLLNKEIKKNNKIKSYIKEIKKSIGKLESMIITIDKLDNLEESYQTLQDTLEEKEELSKVLLDNEKECKTLKSKLDKLKNHKYDDTCEYCLQYPVTKEKKRYSGELDLLNNVILKNKVKSKKLDTTIKKYLKYEKLMNDFVESEKLNAECQSELKTLNNDLALQEKDLEMSNNNIKKYESYTKIELQNKEIDNELSRLKDGIKKVTKLKCTEYLEFVKLSGILKDVAINILQSQNEIDRLNNEYVKINNTIDTLGRDLVKQKELRVKVRLNKKLKNEFDEQNEVYEKNQLLLNDQIDIHNKLNNDLTTLKVELNNEKKLSKAYGEKEQDKSILDIIVKLIDKQGLIDSIIASNVAHRLQNDVNNLMTHITDYSVNISYEKGRFKIMKIENNHQININTLSGSEKLLANVIFKLCLNQYNNDVVIPFLIFDEALACLDNENVAKLPSLFNYIKEQYDFAIIISQDDRIKKLYDTSIEIVRKNDESLIVY